MKILALVAILLGVAAIGGALYLVTPILGLLVGGLLLIMVGAMAYTDGAADGTRKAAQGAPGTGVQTPGKRVARRP